MDINNISVNDFSNIENSNEATSLISSHVNPTAFLVPNNENEANETILQDIPAHNNCINFDSNNEDEEITLFITDTNGNILTITDSDNEEKIVQALLNSLLEESTDEENDNEETIIEKINASYEEYRESWAKFNKKQNKISFIEKIIEKNEQQEIFEASLSEEISNKSKLGSLKAQLRQIIAQE
jgi:hypothetical protein